MSKEGPSVETMKLQDLKVEVNSISNSDDRAEGTVEDYHQNEQGDFIVKSGLKAGISGHAVDIIALCGIIGPGSIIGFGNFLKACGPAGCVAGFAIICGMCVPMMLMIGEMNTIYDSNFSSLASKFVSKGFGASLALAYAIMWMAIIVSEYTGLSSSLTTYTDKVPFYGWFLIMWTIFTCFQLLDVSWWAESEFYLGLLKILFLCGFYVFALVYAGGGIKGHSPGNPFKEDPLNSGIKGIVNGFTYAANYVAGVEAVSVIASETQNVQKSIPKAVKNTVFRVLFVYFGLAISYGITVSYKDENLNNSAKVLRSPMAIALTEAGWVNAKYYIATIVLIVAFSAINTSIYLASRSLFAWAKEGYGPKVFTRVSKRGIPYVAVHFCHLFGFICLLSISEGSSVAYNYIVNVSGVTAFIVWTAICVTHLRFRKLWLQSGRTLADLRYVSPFYPWTNYLTIFIGILLVLVQGWSVFKPFDYKSFIDAYIMIPIFCIAWLWYDVFHFKKGFVKLEEIDFEAGTRQSLDEILKED